MPEYNVVVTREAIYDIAGISDYIADDFSEERAIQFRQDIRAEIQSLSFLFDAYGESGIQYRNYTIYKKPFHPSIIFYVVLRDAEEVHVLRVLRHERDWQRVLREIPSYTYD